jgi:poly-gamma-glutamate capsule biosynthesis protein CapA/YwtB (metallophosphatase superfamily)
MSTSLTREEREARRAHRRSQIRRRRGAALACLGALVVGSIALGRLAIGGDDSARAAATATAGSKPSVRVRTPAARATAQPKTTVSRLGSGKPVTLAFAGDIHFESPIREKLAASPASVLAPIAPVLRRADVAVVNLETAVTDRGVPAPKAYVFRAPTTAFDALKAGGVDVASVANNHGMDFGKTGLRDTLKASKTSGVPVIGAGWNDTQAYAPYRVTVDGQRVAIIGATQVLDDHLISEWSAAPRKMGLASAKDEPRLVRAVRDARKTSDTLVVFLHWGLELSSCPTSFQTSLADKLVAAGADVVVGSHAHVLLGAGTKRKALVAYGLGNFVFYASRESTVQSGVLEVTVTGRRIDDYRWVPARISSGIPYPLSGSSRAQAVSSWKRLRSCTGLQP